MKFEAVDFKQSSKVFFAEHEIHMSFVDNDGANVFYEWWHNKGADLFGDYYTQWLLDEGVPEEDIKYFLRATAETRKKLDK